MKACFIIAALLALLLFHGCATEKIIVKNCQRLGENISQCEAL